MFANTAQVSEPSVEFRNESRREAAPSLAVALGLLVMLAVVSKREGWELLSRVPWWIWLLIAVPELVLIVDLVLGVRGVHFVRTRRAALVLLGVLVLANMAALGMLVASLVTTSTRELGGGELLLTAFVIWVADVIVFGLVLLGDRRRRAGPAGEGAGPQDARLPVPTGREPRVGAAGLAAPGLGLPLHRADQLDRVQSDGRDAAFTAREAAHGARLPRLRRHRAARGRPRRQRSRLLTTAELELGALR